MIRKLSALISGISSLLLVALTVQLTRCTSGESRSEALTSDANASLKALPADSVRIKRGHYLVDITGCHDCHSPKKFTPEDTFLDSSKLLSGHPADAVLPSMDERAFKSGYWMLFSPDITASVGDWGINYSSNLTPDSATGIGAWTENDFIRTIRIGKHMGREGGRDILPPMPWRKFAKMTDEDLKDVYAYLRTIPPIRNQVPSPVPVPPVTKGGKN